MEVSKSSPPRTVESVQSKPNPRNEDRAVLNKAAAQESAERKNQQEKPRPVVNTQGHTTGRLLNVTA